MPRLENITNKIPEFCMTHWIIRIPIIVVFLQQGLDKWPIDAETAESFGLTLLVWTFVVFGEIGGAVGILVGGLVGYINKTKELGDLITRFSGITIASIMTGVIWIGEPASVWDVILYDNLHVFLWVGGMYFALRGNRT